MKFAPETPMSVPEGMQRATVAAGCFWGVEHMYRKDFEGKGLIDARVGYIGGKIDNPTYAEVGRGKTEHAEACQIVFDPSKVAYRTLIEYFFRMHDPTTKGHQGNDHGTQYRSAIFYHSDEQKSIAEELKKKTGEKWWKNVENMQTEIAPAGKWWDAEQYHQMFLHKNPGGYECSSHFVRKFPPLE